MYNYLISFIYKEDILYKFQFGFRKSHSTNHAIISLVEKVNQALDSGKDLVGLFLDLKKTFAIVDHKILVAPNDTAYTRWSCHSGLANPVEIESPPISMRTRWMTGNAPHKSGRC